MSLLPPLLGLGNDISYPLSLSLVNGLGNLIPPSFVLNLSDRSFIFDNRLQGLDIGFMVKTLSQ